MSRRIPIRIAALAGLAGAAALVLAPSPGVAAPVDVRAANAMLRSIPEALSLMDRATGCMDPECARLASNDLVGWRNALRNTRQMDVILRGRMSMCRWTGYNAWRSGASAVSVVANQVTRGEYDQAQKAAAKGKAAFARARGILVTCR
ncbi:MAG: hypothetical protein MUE51_03740 [Thermoleophilia bacterium]|jgi:hypothetical protein|nr:hypothetical protein [Thermoleophilia bacterium]